MKKDNVFLVGLMGAGKTTIGRLLAHTIGSEFIDSDQEIEKATGADIQWIFDVEGESGFRLREQRMIVALCQKKGIVLATGGGTILCEDCQQVLRSQGIVVYLESSVEHLFTRTRMGHDRYRPLLQCDDPEKKLADLLMHREPLYRKIADLTVRTDCQTPRSVVETIVQHLRSL